MKRVSILTITTILTIFLTAGLAGAWQLCFVDTQFTPELQADIDPGNVIRGQAILPGHPSFPAPLTGSLSGGTAYFSIAYLGETGVRFYVIDAASGGGETWGIRNSDSSYYHQGPAQLVRCAAAESESAVESGANE
jgi:hypothetical protein